MPTRYSRQTTELISLDLKQLRLVTRIPVISSLTLHMGHYPQTP